MKKVSEIAVVVQARLGSQRIPQKMIRSFGGTTLTDLMLEKIKNSTVIPEENFYLSAHESG